MCKTFRLMSLIGILIVSALAVSSCDPSDRKGDGDSTVKTMKACLEERGEYSMFLKAVDICGYTRLVDGGGLVTVFAPDDDAFRSWLSDNYGTADVSAVPVDRLSVIVGYHLIQFAYEPEDFLSFNMVSVEDDNPESKRSTCYKYKSYSKEPVKLFKDPLSRREVYLYSREKYLPVFSTRLLRDKGLESPEADYRKFFPDVNWQGDDDRLYAGSAAVTEAGIKTRNGYLYLVDKVLVPTPTIYERLCSEEFSEYSIIKRMFDRIRYYHYDANVTKNYSPTGDSLFFFYHWGAPNRNAEIPEIASEWTYHDESGVVFDRALKYSNNCFFPKDEVLEPYLKEYFKEYGTYEREDFLEAIPKNGIYHFLRAHIYGLQDIIFPSELDMMPINGVNGEKFNVSSDEVDVHYCANGVIYGMDKVFEPAVFSNIPKVVLSDPKFTFYSRAFNVKNMYQQIVDPNNKFTFIIQNDADLSIGGYSSSETAGVNGSYSYRSTSGNMAETAVTNLLMSQFIFGQVPSPGDISYQRYFVAKDGKTYFYVKNHTFYDALDEELLLHKEIAAENGVLYQTDRVLPARKGGYAETAKLPEFAEFNKLMKKADLSDNNSVLKNSMAGLKDALVFFPVNEAVIAAREAGMLPDENDLEALSKYLKYHFVPLKKNKLENFLLPGLGPEGMTDQAYSGIYATMSDYVSESDIKTMGISWTPDNSTYLTLTDMGGNSVTTVPERFLLRHNCSCFAIGTCFDYRTMFGGVLPDEEGEGGDGGERTEDDPEDETGDVTEGGTEGETNN